MDIGNGADTGEDRLTLLGRLKRDARRFGLAPWPVIDSLVDLMGAYGEDFAPQPLIFKEFRLLSSFTDQAMSFAGGGPHRRAWDEAMLGLRQKVSGALEGVVPGVHQVDATDPNATTDDLIASMIAQQHPGYTQEQLVDAMNDPDSDDYKAAFRTRRRDRRALDAVERGRPLLGQDAGAGAGPGDRAQQGLGGGARGGPGADAGASERARPARA